MRGRLGRALRKWHREDDACFCRVRLRLNAQTSAFLAQTRIEFGPQRCDPQAWAESPGGVVGLPQLDAGCRRCARRAEEDGFDRAQKARGAPPRTLERPGQPPQEERLAFGAMRSVEHASVLSRDLAASYSPWPLVDREFSIIRLVSEDQANFSQISQRGSRITAAGIRDDLLKTGSPFWPVMLGRDLPPRWSERPRICYA